MAVRASNLQLRAQSADPVERQVDRLDSQSRKPRASIAYVRIGRTAALTSRLSTGFCMWTQSSSSARVGGVSAPESSARVRAGGDVDRFGCRNGVVDRAAISLVLRSRSCGPVCYRRREMKIVFVLTEPNGISKLTAKASHFLEGHLDVHCVFAPCILLLPNR